MVLKITKYISEQIKASNPYIDAFAFNVIKMKTGEIVNFIGAEKTNFSPTDINGFAAYLRVDPNVTYSKPTRQVQSCENRFLASQDFKIVLFSINQSKRPDPAKLENKIVSDLVRMNFGLYTGKEQSILITLKKSNLDYAEVFKTELNQDYDIGAESVIIGINATLSWSFTKDDCTEECNIWEDVECQII